MERKAGLALVLATVAGFIDAVGFIVLRGLFTAHMSGNSAQVGVRVGRGSLAAAVPLLVAIALFVVGCAVGATVSELARKQRIESRVAVTLALQALLVAAFMLYGNHVAGGGRVTGHSVAGFYVLAALAIFAVGLQAASLTEVGGQTVRTTYISGVLTNLGQGLALRALRGRGDRPARGRMILLWGVVVLYLAGAVAGALLHVHVGMWAMAVPLAMLVGACIEDVRQPFERLSGA